ncbi:lysophosphatidic acid receptor 4-like [Myripristis murdjan]|uniref:lysophosphatidic acid receptor 4-like n=1 Tax=Myripristis murdjan TaxID=586833 RepID=UPI001175DB3E|nr:lysophosphatidic acid receptor 4-like [Myripristis murdjan]
MDSLEENRVNSSNQTSYINYFITLPSWFYSLFIAVNTVNLFLGFPSNGFILWLMVTRAGRVNALEFFSLNLTVSELLFGLSSICAFIYLFHKSVSVFVANVFFSIFLFMGRPLFQTCICVERYIAVVHPVLFLQLKTLKYRVVCCAAVWLLVLGACIMQVLMLNNLILTQCCCIGVYLLLFSVKLFCCLSVLRTLRKPGPGTGGRDKEGSDKVKMKSFKVLLIITVSTVLTYLPFIITFTLYGYISQEQFFASFGICTCFAMMTGIVHPFLYLHRMGKLPCIQC